MLYAIWSTLSGERHELLTDNRMDQKVYTRETRAEAEQVIARFRASYPSYRYAVRELTEDQVMILNNRALWDSEGGRAALAAARGRS